MRFLLTAILAAAFAAPSPAAAEPAPAITTSRPAFYVVIDTGGGDRTTPSITAIAVAGELNKVLTGPSAPWAIPQPSWGEKDLVGRCKDDPEALGGVVIFMNYGFASHFYLLWQSQTSTFTMFAEVIACNRQPGTRTAEPGSRPAESFAAPTVVGIVSQLPGANGTPWVVRRSQTSIPLLSVAAVGTLWSKSSSSSKTTNLTLTALAGTLFSSAGSKDIPGYSDPLRLRYGSIHIGVDFISAMRGDICKTNPSEAGPRITLCKAMGLGE